MPEVEAAFEEIEVDAPRVGIIMGSKNDKPKMQPAGQALQDAGIRYEVRVMSAHRDPEKVREYCHNARMRGLRVIIAGAGMSAALPGVAAAHTDLPVIGVPILGKALGGLDALLSAVQMPPGIPVACVAIDGAKNAGILAARIINAVIPRYTREEIGAVWTDERRMSAWLEVELAATDALGGGGRGARRGGRGVPRARDVHGRGGEGARAHDRPRRRRLRRRRLGLGRRARPLDPLRPHLLGRARHGAGPAAPRGGRVVVAGARAYRDALVARAREHRETLCVGRTHGVHAEPTTFGLRLAGFAFEARPQPRPAHAAPSSRRAVGKLSGAVGTYASIPPAVEARVMESLGLRREDVSTQVVPRDRHAVVLTCARDRRRRPGALRDRGPQPPAHRGPRGRGAVRRQARRAPRRCPTSATRS